MDLPEFLTARYDELERMATDGLCISCQHPVKELYVEMYGLRQWRGYEHDERRDSTGRMHRWQGVRCEGGMTGAEPVQRPDLVLADIAAKRAIVSAYVTSVEACRTDGERSQVLAAIRLTLHGSLCRLAEPYEQHPDYDKAWQFDD